MKKSQFWVLLCILFTAFSLRAPVIGVGPLVEYIRRDLTLSASVAGLITTIPLLSFAALSPAAGPLAARAGLGRCLQAALAAVGIGVLMRSFLGTAGLLAGTVLVGAGIAFGNVLLPAVVKARYPRRIGAMTGVYTMAMNTLAGLSSAISVPLAVRAGMGWQNALAVWSIPPLIGAAVWLPKRKMRLTETGQKSAVCVWRSKTAWWVALYMGFQSLFFYSFMAWAPSVLTAKGFSPETAGYLVTVYQMTGIPANFLTPLLADKVKNHRWLTLGIGGAYVGGFLVFWVGKHVVLLAAALVVMGVGTGACFSYCMALMGLRTENPETAAKLSGMSQTVGYAIAAVGPVLLGRLADRSGSWNSALFCILLMALGITFLGLKACKAELVK